MYWRHNDPLVSSLVPVSKGLGLGPARVILIVLCSWAKRFILTVPHSTLGWVVQTQVKITQG